jgi:hypothetical protein
MGTMLRWAPLAALVLITETAWADRPLFEVAPFGGYRIGGEFDVQDEQGSELRSADLEEDASWGLGLALYRDRNGFYELLYSRQQTQFDDPDPALQSVDITTEYYHFGGTLIFDYEPWLRPYLSLTLGLTRFDAEGFGSEYKFSSSLGLGWRVPVGQHASILLGARGYGTLIDSDTELLCASGNGRGTCLVRTSGDLILQGEATLGVAFTF